MRYFLQVDEEIHVFSEQFFQNRYLNERFKRTPLPNWAVGKSCRSREFPKPVQFQEDQADIQVKIVFIVPLSFPTASEQRAAIGENRQEHGQNAQCDCPA
jgi:hypothetical protein